VWEQPCALLPANYVDGVAAGGGIPVLLPPVGSWDESIVSRLDGLVLAGGPDVEPARYDQPTHPSTGPPRPERDRVELELADAALRLGTPLLGVCRGMQVLNIVMGGTLRQHLPDDLGTVRHLPRPGTFGQVKVRVAEGSLLAEIVGGDLGVSCHHHLGVDLLGAGLVDVAWADDGSVEAVELPGDAFVLGVQWHPEQDTVDRRLFAALVAAAAR
jgi:putative glutamine amidotransferase